VGHRFIIETIMNPLCILFLHHQDDILTNYHYNLIKQFNPATPVIALTFNLGLSHAIKLSIPLPTVRLRAEWRDVDKLIYAWFLSQETIVAERYLILESDTLCNMPAQEFYSSVWDKPSSGACIRTLKTNPKLWILREIKQPHLYNGFLLAVTPICGILLSYEAIKAIALLSQDPKYDPLFSETRIGTLLAESNNVPTVIFPRIDHYISWRPREPKGPGIWHSVKRICLV